MGRPKKRKLPKKAVVSQLNAARGNTGFSQSSAASALLDLQKLRTAGTWVRCSLQHCGKWRKLQEKDPSQVVSKWECRKNPDVDYSQCSTPEQRWSPGPEWVQNRFTVGSLVYAQIQGFPAWPAMVDDDPDTGSFFDKGNEEQWEADESCASRRRGNEGRSDAEEEKLLFGCQVQRSLGACVAGLR